MSATINIPAGYFCPITGTLLEDPVLLTVDGRTYERSSIEEWIRRKGESPYTRQPATFQNLVENRTLKEAIVEWTNAKLELWRAQNGSSGLPSVSSSIPTNQVAQSSRASLPPIVPTASIEQFDDGMCIYISVNPPVLAEREPMDVVLCIDASGSMSGNADKSDNGLSLLDIAKHGCKVVFNLLKDDDRCAIVKFSEKGTVVSNGFVATNAAGKSELTSNINTITAGGGTDIYGGLARCIELVRSDGVSNRTTVVYLLTDGEPSTRPARGIAQQLRKDITERPVNCTINTFGFGYKIEGSLLLDIADVGCGEYSFISTADMLGTCFINLFANDACTVAKQTELHVSFTAGNVRDVSIEKIQHLRPIVESWGIHIPIGTMRSGIPLSYVLELKSSAASMPTVVYSLAYKCTVTKTDVIVDSSTVIPVDDNRMRDTMMRYTVANAFYKKSLEECRAIMPSIKDQFVSTLTPFTHALSEDVFGEISSALESDKSWEWGRWFLPSLMRAHLHCLCTDFKNPGVQTYVSALFEQMRDEGSDIFLTLDPPIPSRLGNNYGYGSYGGSSYSMYDHGGSRSATQTQQPAATATPVNMLDYLNQVSGCMHGVCTTLVKDPTTGVNAFVAMRDVCRGMLVQVDDDEFKRVTYVVKYNVESGIHKYVSFEGGLIITPWHPIFVDDKWEFPSESDDGVNGEVCSDSHYSFVLEDSAHIIVNGIRCATLGHGLKGDVIGHEYFGTNKVIEDLTMMDIDGTGYVVVSNVVRDDTNGNVTKLIA
jgi:uncharacterized protein YegL